MTSDAVAANLDIRTVPLADVKQHPQNARNGDIDAIAESIKAHGLYAPLVVQRSTGFIVKGNNTYAAALSLGIERVPVVLVDVDDEQALKILVNDNRTSDLARYDEAGLADLLTALAESTGLEGTGYDIDALDDLLVSLERASTAPLDAPGERGWAESDEEEAARAASRGNDSIHASGLREAVLVFTLDDHARFVRLVKAARLGLGLGEATVSATVMACVERAAE